MENVYKTIFLNVITPKVEIGYTLIIKIKNVENVMLYVQNVILARICVLSVGISLLLILLMNYMKLVSISVVLVLILMVKLALSVILFASNVMVIDLINVSLAIKHLKIDSYTYSRINVY